MELFVVDCKWGLLSEEDDTLWFFGGSLFHVNDSV